MKNKELVNALLNLDPEGEVLVLVSNDNPIDNDGELINAVFEIKGHVDKEINGVYIDCTVR